MSDRAVAVIGGGRWARTIVRVLAGLPGAPQTIALHSRHNAAGLRDWAKEPALEGRIHISHDWPDYKALKPRAVIVANAAADHRAAALPALEAGIPVLVEKPVMIGAPSLQDLCDRAAGFGAILAASHVVLFARYLKTFVAQVAGRGPLQSLEIVWEDGRGDVVRGEQKNYDAATPVFDDVLPHVMPMLTRFLPDEPVLDDVRMEEGGARVRLTAGLGGVPVVIGLARNAPARRRWINAVTAQGPCSLDFSSEPGVMSLPGCEPANGDPLWNGAALRPLGVMLTAFLRAADGEALDPRLSPHLALSSARFADLVRAGYRDRQRAWLETVDAETDASRYAREEMAAVQAGVTGN